MKVIFSNSSIEFRSLEILRPVKFLENAWISGNANIISQAGGVVAVFEAEGDKNYLTVTANDDVYAMFSVYETEPIIGSTSTRGRVQVDTGTTTSEQIKSTYFAINISVNNVDYTPSDATYGNKRLSFVN